MAAVRLHATNWNGDDRTLCGLANEAGDDGETTGEAENPVYAEVGQWVTCESCRQVIDHVRGCFSIKYQRWE